MGANRKLQIEIDRTLKKVAEGIETFDEIWEKVRRGLMQGATSLTQICREFAMLASREEKRISPESSLYGGKYPFTSFPLQGRACPLGFDLQKCLIVQLPARTGLS